MLVYKTQTIAFDYEKVLFFALVLTIATACSQTKDSYLEGFKLFVESVQKNAQDYTKADWEKADEQFTKLKDSYNNFSKQMTSDEKGEVIKLESTYAALKLKKIGDDVKESTKDAFEKVKDTAKDVKEGAQKAAKKGEKAMEGIKDGLKD
ncbi:hypothetical protein NXY02_08915 [Bacteroides fragilis]|nr:hypothetical protein [Bacteroides fragilis]